jgi:hypothetical protein
MNVNFHIRLRAGLRKAAGSTKRGLNTWCRETIVAALGGPQDQLAHLGSILGAARQIADSIARLEWSLRRLDMAPPSDAMDQDLALVLRASHASCANGVQECAILVSEIGAALADLLGVPGQRVTDIYSRANDAVHARFAITNAPTAPLNSDMALALLAVVCDVVEPPPGEELVPVLAVALTQGMLVPGLMPASGRESPKDLRNNGHPMKLKLNIEDYRTIQALREVWGWSQNRFALEVLYGHLDGRDLQDVMIYDGLRSTVRILDDLLHTTVAVRVAASAGILICQDRSHRDFLRGVHHEAKALGREARGLIRVAAGSGIWYDPYYKESLRPLIGVALAGNGAGGMGRSELDTEARTIIEYLSLLRIVN